MAMNKKTEYKPPVDLAKLLKQCKDVLKGYPDGVAAERIREQIKDIERRIG